MGFEPENRKYVRLQVPIGVVYRLIDKKAKNTKEVLTLAVNIGGGGISLVAKDNLRQGDLLAIQIHVPHHDDPIRAVGEVVWFYGPQAPGKGRVGLEAGVRFCDIAPEDLKVILDYVHSVGIG